MRLFHAQVLDVYLEGNLAYAYASEPWACLLSRAEALRFICVVDEVSGTSPALTMRIFGNAMPNNTYFETTTVLLSAVSLVAGPNTFATSYLVQDANNPPPKYLYLHTHITGTNPKAHVRAWVCGRGPQLLEQTPNVSATFAAQYAAARMITDEGLLPGRKRSLPQGASLFYPPELFLPTLTWER